MTELSVKYCFMSPCKHSKVLPSEQSKIPSTSEDCKMVLVLLLQCLISRCMYAWLYHFVNMYSFLIFVFKYAVMI